MSKIRLQNGWNPGFGSGQKVVATRDWYTIKEGDILEYRGGCDHPDWGWAVQLEGGKPDYLPGETPKSVGTHSVPGYEFEHCFETV